MTSGLNWVFGKMSRSAVNVMVVPLPRAGPTFLIRLAATPRANDCSQRKPSRLIRAVIDDESAVTTDAPTPCSPPAW